MTVVALAASPGSGRALAPLVALVGHGHRIVSWHRHGGPGTGLDRIDVVVASDPETAGLVGDRVDDAREPAVPPPLVACHVASAVEVDAARGLDVAVVFTSQPHLTARGRHADPPVVFVPAEGIDVGRYPVLPPLTRARMRAALDLPDPLVLAVDRAAPPPDRSTGLALASAAVVDGALVPLALALGTPTVTDAASAARFGLTDGVEVVVAPSPDVADGLAAELARDEARAAALSRAARAAAEARFDLGASARVVRRALGLEPEPALIDLRLQELATPTSSRLHARAHHALALFTLESSP